MTRQWLTTWHVREGMRASVANAKGCIKGKDPHDDHRWCSRCVPLFSSHHLRRGINACEHVDRLPAWQWLSTRLRRQGTGYNTDQDIPDNELVRACVKV